MKFPITHTFSDRAVFCQWLQQQPDLGAQLAKLSDDELIELAATMPRNSAFRERLKRELRRTDD